MTFMLLRVLPCALLLPLEALAMIELELHAERDHANPFTDVIVTATFTSPSGDGPHPDDWVLVLD